MQRFIGTKQVKAEEMTLGEFHRQQGGQVPSDVDAGRQGFLVEDEITGERDWVADAEFDFNPVNKLTFGVAAENAKKGARIARAGWNGRNMFLFYAHGKTVEVTSPPLTNIYPQGTKVRKSPYLAMKTAQNDIVPWTPSIPDSLADDWFIVE